MDFHEAPTGCDLESVSGCGLDRESSHCGKGKIDKLKE
jgi:hypothetical protein